MVAQMQRLQTVDTMGEGEQWDESERAALIYTAAAAKIASDVSDSM